MKESKTSQVNKIWITCWACKANYPVEFLRSNNYTNILSSYCPECNYENTHHIELYSISIDEMEASDNHV